MVFFTILFSILCFFVSCMIHIHSFIHFGNPSDKLIMVLGFWSLLIILYPTLFELRSITRGFNKEDYINAAKYIFPKWAICILVVLLFYALSNTAYYFIFIRMADAPPGDEVSLQYFKYRLYSSFWMTQHFLVFTLLWGIISLKKNNLMKADSE